MAGRTAGRPLVIFVLLLAACAPFLLTLPDGTGQVLPLTPERVTLLASGEGQLAAALARDPGQRLRACEHHARGSVLGPESISVAANGSLFALDRTGVLHRADGGPGGYVLASGVAYVGPGRPLGSEAHGSHLLIADSLKGMLELDLRTGRLSILSNQYAYANDVAVEPVVDNRGSNSSSYGRVYFTSSTREPVELKGGFYDTMGGFLRVMLRGDETGRLLRYDPDTRATQVLLDGLAFANGVALSSDGSFVLVVETLGLRVLRLWLRGPKAGHAELFAGALPGFPDGISRSADGRSFWLAVLAPWSPLLKVLRYRALRGALARVLFLVPRLAHRVGLVLRLSAEDGSVEDVLADRDGRHVAAVSAVTEAADGRLLLGQLMGDSLVVCRPHDMRSAAVS